MTMDQGYDAKGGRRRWAWAVFLFSVLVTAIRLWSLASVEPRYDQAFYAWWVRELADAGHVLPRALPGEGMADALKGDVDSVVHQLLRNVYNKPTAVLTLVPVALMWAVVKSVGFSYAALSMTSIVVASLLLPLLALFPMDGGKGSGSRPGMGAPAAMILAALNPYLFWVSPEGVHNFGMVALVAALAVTQARMLGRTTERVEVLVHGCALFCHWTNLFLLPLIGFASRLFDWNFRERRLSSAFRYGLWMAVIGGMLSPLLVIEYFRSAEAQVHSLGTVLNLTVGGDGTFWRRLVSGGEAWLRTGLQSFGPPGMVGALAGLILLWRGGIRIPLMLVGLHFAAYLVLPGFVGASWRVFAYVVPVLCLGLGGLLVHLMRSETLWRRAAGLLLLAGHLAVQVPPLVAPSRAAAAMPEFWDLYYRGQGELRPMYGEVEALLPRGSVLLSWSYDHYCVYQALRGPDRVDIRMPTTVESLWTRRLLGNMDSFIARRRDLALESQSGQSVFLLTEDHEETPASAGFQDILRETLGAGGLNLRRDPRMMLVRRWTLTTSSPGNSTLWEIVEADGQSRQP